MSYILYLLRMWLKAKFTRRKKYVIQNMIEGGEICFKERK